MSKEAEHPGFSVEDGAPLRQLHENSRILVDVCNPHDHDVDLQLLVRDPQVTDYNSRFNGCSPSSRAGTQSIWITMAACRGTPRRRMSARNTWIRGTHIDRVLSRPIGESRTDHTVLQHAAPRMMRPARSRSTSLEHRPAQ